MTHIVIGGGASGLAAAIELALAGRSVTVLEASAALGGRARSRHEEGFTVNLGPHALYAGAEQALARLGVRVAGGIPKDGLTMELGDRLAPLPSDALTLLGNGGLGWRDKWRLGAMLGRIPRLDPTALDGLSVAAWLDAQGFEGVARDVAHAVVRVSSYVSAPERLSAGAAVRQIQGALGGVRYLDGGWQTIVDGLVARAEALGVRTRVRATVERIEVEGGRARAVHLTGGERLACDALVLTLSPKASARLLGEHASPTLVGFAAEASAVRAACLDVALRRLPRRHPSLILGTDAPIYVSIHSNVAALAPEGGGLIHAARYLAPGERVTDATRAGLEARLDASQPGWRAEVVDVRWSGAATVAHAFPEAARGGLAGRPSVASAGPANVALAGDWVGPEGMLLDACLASARQAAARVASPPARAAA
ncbi:MAG: NAD(P)/FAD-dependent oxidoreductase [Sandaracinaceae bacterium]|nr:NAD(P)/FAD-dependent oxidoreductase [Sandaracinaceae bacterium]